jgi:hypothetical protein
MVLTFPECIVITRENFGKSTSGVGRVCGKIFGYIRKVGVNTTDRLEAMLLSVLL